MSSVHVSITLEEDLLDELDDLRGLVSRSAYIQDVLEHSITKKRKKL